MKAKRIVLEYDIEFRYTLIGISSSLKSFRLIHFLNKNLNTGFIKLPDMEYNISRKTFLTTSCYHYYNDIHKNNWIFFANKSEQGPPLIPKYKALDYFILIDDEVADDYIVQIKEALRTIKKLNFANIVNTTLVNDINQLYSDIELHIMSFYKKIKEKKHLW